jgi:hypothetical protein
VMWTVFWSTQTENRSLPASLTTSFYSFHGTRKYPRVLFTPISSWDGWLPNCSDCKSSRLWHLESLYKGRECTENTEGPIILMLKKRDTQALCITLFLEGLTVYRIPYMK